MLRVPGEMRSQSCGGAEAPSRHVLASASQDPAACPAGGLRRPQCPAKGLPASILTPTSATTAVSSARGLRVSFCYEYVAVIYLEHNPEIEMFCPAATAS